MNPKSPRPLDAGFRDLHPLVLQKTFMTKYRLEQAIGMQAAEYATELRPVFVRDRNAADIQHQKTTNKHTVIMPATNLVSAALTPADQQAVLDAIATIRTKLPFLIDLSNDDRAGLVKFGPKSYDFVDKALQTAQANAQIIPPAFDLAEFARDYALWKSLQPVALQLTQLQEFFDDTMAALGSDLFSEALSAYTYMKAAGSGQGIDDLKALLSQRFSRKSASPAPAPTPA